jgi:hypothetical protein
MQPISMQLKEYEKADVVVATYTLISYLFCFRVSSQKKQHVILSY